MLPPQSRSCSTLQRVYPLATALTKPVICDPCILQYPPTGLSSGNLVKKRTMVTTHSTCSTLQRVYPLATETAQITQPIAVVLAVPSNGSILWQRFL